MKWLSGTYSPHKKKRNPYRFLLLRRNKKLQKFVRKQSHKLKKDDMHTVISKSEWIELLKNRAPMTKELVDKYRREGRDTDQFPFAIREDIEYEDELVECQDHFGVPDLVTAYQIFEFLERNERNTRLTRDVYCFYEGMWHADSYWGGGHVRHLNKEWLRPYIVTEKPIEIEGSLW
jgi:hypothetical protein